MPSFSKLLPFALATAALALPAAEQPPAHPPQAAGNTQVPGIVPTNAGGQAANVQLPPAGFDTQLPPPPDVVPPATGFGVQLPPPDVVPVVNQPPVGSTAIDEALLTSFRWYEQYSAAAYCPWNFNATHGRIYCNAGACDDVGAADTQSLYDFGSSLLADCTGYIALDKTNKEIVLAFRGALDPLSFITDDFFQLARTPWCPGCYAATGFVRSWNDVKYPALAAIEDALGKFPGFRVVATGHSLGAALASVAAADLRWSGYAADLITFGGPRVGNRAFADYLTDFGGCRTARVTSGRDLIPLLPPASLGYAHLAPEYWINGGSGGGGALGVVKSLADIKACTGVEDRSGNLQFSVADGNLDDHFNYFQRVGC